MNVTELLEMGRAEAQRLEVRKAISLTKNAVININAILFPIPIPTLAEVRVVDKDFHLRGDINWDGKIDDKDVELLVAAYGSIPGSPNWNPACDLNNDGKVDINDLAILAGNYGTTAPKYETSCEIEVVVGKCVLIATAMEQELKETVTTKTDETLFVLFVYDVPLGMFSRAVTPPLPIPVM